jgi:PAS domain S-box-containing protein
MTGKATYNLDGKPKTMTKAGNTGGKKKKPAASRARAGKGASSGAKVQPAAPRSRKVQETLEDEKARATFSRQRARMDERTGGEADRVKELYRDLFDFTPVGYLELNPEYLIVNANLTASRILQIERAKISGRPFSSLVPPQNQTQCFQFLRGLLDKAKPQTCTLPLKVGTQTVWARIEGVPVTDASGTVLSGRVSFLDVTAQIEAEQALAQSEQRYRGLVELSPAPVIVHRSGRILYANPAAARIFGVGSAEELPGRSTFEFIAPEYHQLVRERVRKVQEEGTQAPRREIRLIRADGTEVWIEAAATRVTYQGQPATQVIYHELTERRKAEASVREAAEQWRRTFDSIPDPIMIIDDQQRLVRMNAATGRALGQDPRKLLGKHCYELFHGNRQPHARCPHLQTIADGMEHTEEVHEPKFNRHFLVTTTPLIGPEGRANATVHVMRDVTEAKQAAHALAESERKFRNIIASSPLGFQMYELRPDGELIFIEANRAADSILGIDNQKSFGRTLEEAFPAVVGTEVPEIYRRVASGADPVMLENYSYRDPRIAGVFECFFFQVAPGYSASLFRDVSERRRLEQELETHRERLAELVEARTAEVHDVIRDLRREVAERRRAEVRVKAERQRFNDVLETLPAYVILLTPDYYMPFANRVFREAFGEAKGRRCFEFLFNRAEPCENCETYTVLKTGAPHRWEWTGPNGRDYDIYDFPFTDTDGASMIMETGIDVTERKRAEEELRRSEASLAEAQRIAHLGNWDWDLMTDGLIWSDETYRIFGLTPQEFAATYDAFLAVVPPEDRNLVTGAVDAALRKERSFSVEHRVVLPNGELRVVHARGEVTFDPVGKPARIIGTIQDITEHKRAEEARDRAEQEVERQRTMAIRADRLRSLGEMAAGIAHELNQPLMGIRNLAEHMQISLQKGWDMPLPTVERKTTDIIAQVDRMSNVIEHTRLFARGGSTDNNAQLVSVNDVINDAMSLIGAQLKARGIDLTIDQAPALPRPRLNPYSLEEVILNLISNARDAVMEAAEDGQGPAPAITVRTLAAREGGGDEVKIQIIDQGRGIRPEVMDKLFEPFFTTKPPGQGTGLGLSICKSLVERWNGRIDLESQPGRGTTVTVTLPCPRDA